jgi:hypothetical protein
MAARLRQDGLDDRLRECRDDGSFLIKCDLYFVQKVEQIDVEGQA